MRHISQPAIIKSISKLEENLGVIVYKEFQRGFSLPWRDRSFSAMSAMH